MFNNFYNQKQKKIASNSTQYSTVLDPHQFKRLLIPLPRFLLNTTTLPNLIEHKGQFIKSAITYSPEEERIVRILYWYKDEILKRLKLTWSSVISFFFLSLFVQFLP